MEQQPEMKRKHPALIVLTSFLMLGVIVAGIVGVAWGLVHLSQKTKSPTSPNADGTIVLEAKQATIMGKGEARFNILDGVANIGWWDGLAQSLQWDMEPSKAGLYRIQIRYARADRGTTTCSIRCGTKTIPANFPFTGGNRSWKTFSPGTIVLPANQRVSFLLKPVHSPTQQIINLAEIRLIPITKK